MEEGTALRKVKGLANLSRGHLIPSPGFGEACMASAPAFVH